MWAGHTILIEVVKDSLYELALRALVLITEEEYMSWPGLCSSIQTRIGYAYTHPNYVIVYMSWPRLHLMWPHLRLPK